MWIARQQQKIEEERNQFTFIAINNLPWRTAALVEFQEQWATCRRLLGRPDARLFGKRNHAHRCRIKIVRRVKDLRTIGNHG